MRGDDVGGDNPIQEARLFPVYLASFFFLKFSFRRAMLQLEFGESKPDESQSEQSITEMRKAASCSPETRKSNTGCGPDAPSRSQTIFGKVLYSSHLGFLEAIFIARRSQETIKQVK